MLQNLRFLKGKSPCSNKQVLPFTVSLAELVWSPTLQEYSPVSPGSRWCTRSSLRVPSCHISYLELECRRAPSFLHSTSALLTEISQRSRAVPPTSTSSFLSCCFSWGLMAVKWEINNTWTVCSSARSAQLSTRRWALVLQYNFALSSDMKIKPFFFPMNRPILCTDPEDQKVLQISLYPIKSMAPPSHLLCICSANWKLQHTKVLAKQNPALSV